MSAEELAAMDAKIVADTIAEMQRQIEQLTGARHSMYDPAVAIARDIANRTPPAMSADHIGEASKTVAPVEAVAWRGIATAPRDNNEFLVAWTDGGVCIGWWNAHRKYVDWQDSLCPGEQQPTHWMPLPPPPSAHPAPIKPSVDTGELREKMKRAIWTQLPQEDANMGTSGRIADAILDLIQSERADSPTS